LHLHLTCANAGFRSQAETAVPETDRFTPVAYSGNWQADHGLHAKIEQLVATNEAAHENAQRHWTTFFVMQCIRLNT
jgi:hypothetical protein